MSHGSDQTSQESAGELAHSPTGSSGGMVAVAESRAAQEVQAAMLIAKRFPRDHNVAYERIMRSCRRSSLAETAMYAYPKGGTIVTGPSIRLAEVLAQNWGNIDFGIVELEQKGDASVMMSYAWDLETNTRQTKVFTVKHIRHTKRGQYDLRDPREIYELTANQGARRLRACILGVIPGDIVDDAVAECDKTMRGESKEPLQDRVRKMVSAFGELGVTAEMVESKIGHSLSATIETEVATLRKIYRSIKDGMSPVESWFDLPKTRTDSSASSSDQLADQLDRRSVDPTRKPDPVKPLTSEQIDHLEQDIDSADSVLVLETITDVLIERLETGAIDENTFDQLTARVHSRNDRFEEAAANATTDAPAGQKTLTPFQSLSAELHDATNQAQRDQTIAFALKQKGEGNLDASEYDELVKLSESLSVAKTAPADP